MDAFGDVLVNVYGATETGLATIATPDDLRDAPGTVGKPSLRLTVKILDEDGREVPRGAVGEVYTGGGLRFAGYTGGGGKEMLDGLTGTGDLGHLDEAGRLFIDGRADDMIVSGGENVFPGEVENLLGGHPGIAEVSVTGVDDEQFGQRLAAYVVRTPGSKLAEDDIKTHVKEHLARYKVPRDVHFVRQLPAPAPARSSRRRYQAEGVPGLGGASGFGGHADSGQVVEGVGAAFVQGAAVARGGLGEGVDDQENTGHSAGPMAPWKSTPSARSSRSRLRANVARAASAATTPMRIASAAGSRSRDRTVLELMFDNIEHMSDPRRTFGRKRYPAIACWKRYACVKCRTPSTMLGRMPVTGPPASSSSSSRLICAATSAGVWENSSHGASGRT